MVEHRNRLLTPRKERPNAQGCCEDNPQICQFIATELWALMLRRR